MVNFPHGGTNFHTTGRGLTHLAGSSRANVATHAGASGSGTTPGPRPSLAEAPPSAQPAKEAGRATWSAARLLSALLRVLTAAGTTGGAEAASNPRASLSADLPQPAAGPTAQPRLPAGLQFITTLLRVITGAGPSHTAPSGSPPVDAHRQQPAETAQQTPQPRIPQEVTPAAPRPDLAAPPAAAGTTAIDVPRPAVASPGEHPSPRAELVPPGDGVPRRDGTDLPIVPAALVALALPALAAVLASIF